MPQVEPGIGGNIWHRVDSDASFSNGHPSADFYDAAVGSDRSDVRQGAVCGPAWLRKVTLMFLDKTVRAAGFLFKGPLILLMLVVINAMTSPGHWWVKWAALGIGIAWVISLLRVLKLAVLVGGVAGLIALLRKR